MVFKRGMFFAIALCLFAVSVPTVSGQTYTRVKCPASGMTFTLGLPMRVLADGGDINGYLWNDQQQEAAEVRFFADGVQKAVDGHSRGYNHFEAIMTDLGLGSHYLTTQSLNYGNLIVNSAETVFVTIAAMPVKSKAISLTTDIVLSGSQDLDWQDAIVQGNGFKVTSANGWTGSIIIKNCFVTGLAVPGAVIPDTAVAKALGINVSTQGGSVTLQNTVFEWTGAQKYDVNGSGTVSVRNCEFRANAFIAYDSSNPARSPFMEFSGNSSGAKVFSGNNVGAGFLYVHNMRNWLVGGSTDADANIFIGPRIGPNFQFCTNVTIRGNYSNHDYHGGWSQGMNFNFYGNDTMLCEHNVIRQGSWPVQTVSGEFRYNLVADCGHDWLRTALSGAAIHHNLFVEPGPPGDPNAGIWLYGSDSGITIYNNTFDGGNYATWLPSPGLAVSKGTMVAVVKNNVFTRFAPDSTVCIVDRYTVGGEKDSAARLLSADYNCFYNPKSRKVKNYGDMMITGVLKGASGYGGHDLGGLNGQADPKFKQPLDTVYPVNESDVWKRVKTVSQVLAEFRDRYTPAAGSPVIDAGDPADGPGVDIGAVGAGTNDPADQFGKFGTSSTRRDIKPSSRSVSDAFLGNGIPGEIAIFDIAGKKVKNATLIKSGSGIKIVLQNGSRCGQGVFIVKAGNAHNFLISRVASIR